MQVKQLTITVLEIDKIIGLNNYHLSIGNGVTSTSISFYQDNELFKNFAQSMIDFPKTVNDTVFMEIGKDSPSWSNWISLRVYCYEPDGRTALHVVIKNNKEAPETNKCEFFITTIPASINNLGQILMSWNPEESNKISWIAE